MPLHRTHRAVMNLARMSWGCVAPRGIGEDKLGGFSSHAYSINRKIRRGDGDYRTNTLAPFRSSNSWGEQHAAVERVQLFTFLKPFLNEGRKGRIVVRSNFIRGASRAPSGENYEFRPLVPGRALLQTLCQFRRTGANPPPLTEEARRHTPPSKHEREKPRATVPARRRRRANQFVLFNTPRRIARLLRQTLRARCRCRRRMRSGRRQERARALFRRAWDARSWRAETRVGARANAQRLRPRGV